MLIDAAVAHLDCGSPTLGTQADRKAVEVSAVRRRADERGAAAVEFALVLPIVVLLLFGIVEMSFAFHGYQSTRLAMNDGLREGSVARRDSHADRQIAAAVQRRLRAAGGSEIERLVVFRAASPNAQPSASCQNGVADASCSVYTRAQVAAMATTPCYPADGCAALTCTSGWCPSNRRDGDLLGVWVRVRYRGITGLLNNGLSARATFRDVGVLPIEPRVVDV